ncbi:mechanosensitive ion channel family protein [Escherichia coli]|uniref:Mechanosensitive ion channel family protein n=1 Tax=Escherichia coli TaxID=562 RepID=A0A2X3KKL8_ECOLX|nr:mechanosensitive ion channel family protein [Escherichia coli]
MLIALLSVIVLWSEIHSAFGFLENISLWDVTSTVQGVESLEPITLGAVLIAILGVYHHHAAGAQPARAAGTGDFAAPGFNAGYGLRHHHHHQISADADWRAGRLLDDWY